MHRNLAVLNHGAVFFVDIKGSHLYSPGAIVCVYIYIYSHTHTHTHTLQGPGCTDSWCHFVYRHYRDLALFNLGAIFHQAHYPAEAAIILHAAVDHAPLIAQSHFLLGNVYAILGDCNR